MFDKDITVVNKVYDKETRMNKYRINHIKGFWSSNKGITISNTELLKSDGLVCRILMSQKGYIKPNEFQESEEAKWTLRNDDYLVKGLVDSVTTIANLKDNYECMKITNVSVKDYGSIDMQHFEISGE